MKSNTKIIIVVEVIMVMLAISIFGTMAYFSIGSKQELANSFSSGCLNITLEDVSSVINLPLATDSFE